MFKRIIASALMLGALVVSNHAYASRAREIVMGSGDPFRILSGTGTHGSFYYDDNYNIFYNPSYANDFKNWAAIEKSNGTPGSASASRAEGGFVASMSTFALGAYFDRTDGIAPGSFFTVPVVAPAVATPADLRPFDLILAGDMGVKWGLGLSYGSARISDDRNAHDWTGRVGIQVADFEPFVAYTINATNSLTAGAPEAKFKNFTVGTRYKMGEWNPYAAFNTHKVTVSDVDSGKTNSWGVGLGRNAKIGEGSRLNYDIAFWHNNTQGAGNRNLIPIDLSAEADLTSWIVGRAGLTYNLYDRTNNASNGDSTSGRLGATFKLGKVNFDWAVGARTTNGTGTASTGTYGNVDGDTFDIGSGFFSNASMTYTW